MIRFVTDEDFNGRIVRGLFLRKSDLDLVRVQDINLLSAGDPNLLSWAENNQRILLTHDGRTMPGHLRDHLTSGRHVPGIVIVDDLAPIGFCIDEILLFYECSKESEWQDQIVYLPFK
jgi:hypothetical protein